MTLPRGHFRQITAQVDPNPPPNPPPNPAPLDPASVPDRIINLSSEDDGIRTDARKRLEDDRKKHSNDAKASQFLSDVTEVLYSKVSTISALRKRYTEELDDLEGQKEQAVLIIGAILGALAGSVAGILAAILTSGAVPGAFKMYFSWYKSNRKKELRTRLQGEVLLLLDKAIDTVKDIHDKIYGGKMILSEEAHSSSGSLASAFAKTIFP